MMKGSLPERASSPMAFGAAFERGAFVGAKSGTSWPVHLTPSHHTHFFRSLHGRPRRSAEARLYRMRRLAGQAQPHSSWAPGGFGASGCLPAARVRSGGGNTPQEIQEAQVVDPASLR